MGTTADFQMACMLCRSLELEKLSVNGSFGVDILECGQCGFVQSEYVAPSALEAYYATYYRADMTDYEIDLLRKKSLDQAIFQLGYLQSLIPDPKLQNALDFGAGEGELARLLKTLAVNVYATEADPRYAELLKKETGTVFLEEAALNDTRFENFFDLISASHVLEHLTNPLTTLDRFSRLLKKGGFLFVDIPNEIEMLKRAGFQAKGHLHYFTPDSFTQMVAAHAKFDILEIRTCNHSVEEFIESGFTLPEQHFRLSTPNGTVIRSLLKNARPDAAVEINPTGFMQPGRLLDDYSRRMVHLHHQVGALQKQKKEIEEKYRALVVENECLSERLHQFAAVSPKNEFNPGSRKLSADAIDNLDQFFQDVKNTVYPELPSGTHQHFTRKMLDRFCLEFSLPEQSQVLDVGCGQGVALGLFKAMGFSATGITLSMDDLSTCRLNGHTVLQMDQSFLEFNEDTFDLIWCRHCIEHSVIPYFTLRGFFRVLKPLGYLYVEVPAPDTACRHQKNKNHYSVLGKTMWTELIRRAGFDLLEVLDISLNVPAGPDTYWAFIHQKPGTG